MTAKVYISRLATKKLVGKILDDETHQQLVQQIEDGLEAEKKIITYVDTLVTA